MISVEISHPTAWPQHFESVLDGAHGPLLAPLHRGSTKDPTENIVWTSLAFWAADKAWYSTCIKMFWSEQNDKFWSEQNDKLVWRQAPDERASRVRVSNREEPGWSWSTSCMRCTVICTGSFKKMWSRNTCVYSLSNSITMRCTWDAAVRFRPLHDKRT